MAPELGAAAWIRFLRQYGPIPRNDNMYDETIQRAAARAGFEPILFEHPFQTRVLECFSSAGAARRSVVLTGTAGDGKTHLCRQVWNALGGNAEQWAADSPYLTLSWRPSGAPKDYLVHFIRDLSAWAPQQGVAWEPAKEAVIARFSKAIFAEESADLFLIAANDGQLMESWRRLRSNEEIQRAGSLLEDWLVDDRQEAPGVRLRLLNLSRGSSAELFDRALPSFLAHQGWVSCFEKAAGPEEVFGPRCPIRYNYSLLKDQTVVARLRALFELCDYNGLHVPIRQILLLLTNAVLGHRDAKDYLLSVGDVPKILEAGTASKASLYNNVFGGNLPEIRRRAITIFDYFERFQIGYETSNRIDNMLIFGDGEPELKPYFDRLIAADTFYGADARYHAAKHEYIEGADEQSEQNEFLPLLVSQRRGLFFKIPAELEDELKLWELTVFKFAGQYLSRVVRVLQSGGVIDRPILWQISKGLNRIFTGMLVNVDRALILATSGNFSQAKVSRVSVDRVSVEPSKGEKVAIRYDANRNRVVLDVHLTPDIVVTDDLNLVRYEFLSRVALDGALPSSFSKECYEDMLAFKSRLLVAHRRRSAGEGEASARLDLKLLAVSENGAVDEKFIEVSE